MGILVFLLIAAVFCGVLCLVMQRYRNSFGDVCRDEPPRQAAGAQTQSALSGRPEPEQGAEGTAEDAPPAADPEPDAEEKPEAER